GQQGAIARYLAVAAGYERAVEGVLGDLLHLVIVERPDQAFAGFQIVRGQDAGRCGFLITSPHPLAGADVGLPPPGAEPGRAGVGADLGRPLDQHVNANEQETLALVRLSTVVGVNGPFSESIRRVVGDAWIADS